MSVDLGANVGYTAVHLAVLYPSARIVAVEMDAQNLDLCRTNTSHIGDRCKTVHAAVWSANGSVAYSGVKTNGYRISRDGQVEQTPGAPTAPARALSDILDDSDIHNVDYLKMDIEGAEAEVLRNVDQWGPRVESMSIEVHSPVSVEGCLDLLQATGFNCEKRWRHPGAIYAARW